MGQMQNGGSLEKSKSCQILQTKAPLLPSFQTRKATKEDLQGHENQNHQKIQEQKRNELHHHQERRQTMDQMPKQRYRSLNRQKIQEKQQTLHRLQERQQNLDQMPRWQMEPQRSQSRQKVEQRKKNLHHLGQRSQEMDQMRHEKKIRQRCLGQDHQNLDETRTKMHPKAKRHEKVDFLQVARILERC